MLFFKILWTVDALASFIVFYFFFIGLADGTVSSRNIGLWLMITGALTGILLGSIWLKNHHQLSIGMGLLIVLAIPVLLYIIYILAALFGNQRWN